MTLPVCYTFRRCPYAIRARMALHSAQIEVQYREIVFKNKPPQMLGVSPKGTVPVLVLNDGTIIDESWGIMCWALSVNDPENWLGKDEDKFGQALQLVKTNDGEFKDDLDRYKYADRNPEMTPEEHRFLAETFLRQLENRLETSAYLVGGQIGIADIALFPFVRQFAMVDIERFKVAPYPKLRSWLDEMLDMEGFRRVMKKLPIWEF